ncbi:unnamed protein product [Linum trigynum]|uniref:SUI1 domain-containing protein n=1 Tax=Linum trigynum TaxID=586398 RepID=A0AAV2FI99_9ROSI
MVELDFQIPSAIDPFAKANDSSGSAHQGAAEEWEEVPDHGPGYERILKDVKKDFCCNGNVVNDKELGKVIQLQGDQRKNVQAFLA